MGDLKLVAELMLPNDMVSSSRYYLKYQKINVVLINFVPIDNIQL